MHRFRCLRSVARYNPSGTWYPRDTDPEYRYDCVGNEATLRECTSTYWTCSKAYTVNVICDNGRPTESFFLDPRERLKQRISALTYLTARTAEGAVLLRHLNSISGGMSDFVQRQYALPQTLYTLCKATCVGCMRVICHLHFWQNDRDLSCGTAVSLRFNGYQNKVRLQLHKSTTLCNSFGRNDRLNAT